MKINLNRHKVCMLAVLFGMLAAGSVMAAERSGNMQEEIAALRQEVKAASEWKDPDTLVHLAGYADVGYIDSENEPSTYTVGTFSPIFHYQFRDIVMLEAELEFEIGEDGETETGIDYMAINVFLNDYVALVAGKFLSPLGQFRQNLHPSWINKMASAPIGFGHDQAAPNAEVGLQFRGGLPLGGNTLNYALYVGNGPALEADGGEIEMIESPGLGKDGDGNKVAGGRVGFYLPAAKLEIGLSAASGEASVRDMSTDPITYEQGRDYEASGADFAFRLGQLDLRGEYIKQEVADLPGSAYATEGGIWEAWYVQAAYQIVPGKWELVLRTGEYDTPHASQDREQNVIGVNYLFAANVVAKVNYEANDNPNAGFESDNRWFLQLAYGF